MVTQTRALEVDACRYVILWDSLDWSLRPRGCNFKNTCAEGAAQSLVAMLDPEVATKTFGNAFVSCLGVCDITYFSVRPVPQYFGAQSDRWVCGVVQHALKDS